MDKQELLQKITALFQQQNWLQMEKVCTKALQYFPDSASTYYNRAIARAKLGHFKEAREDLKKSLELKPGQKEAKLLLDKVQGLGKSVSKEELSPSLLFEQEKKDLVEIFEQKIVETPKEISRYQVLEELGRGGMGVVYKAFDPQMNKFVALKVILGGSEEQQVVEKFLQEAKTMAKFSHANIVRVYDVGESDSKPFICIDYIEGKTLKEYLQNAPFNVRLFCQWMIKIGWAIAYAHGKGIVHRDLKPANIMLDKNNELFVMDFGLAKLIHTDKSLSKKGAVIGTPQYMSPQQAKGEKVNHLTDVYALGAIFYEMLAGKPMVQGATIAEVMFKVIHKEPKLLRQVNNKLSIDLETICAKTTEKEAAKRYKSAREFVEDIDKFLHGELISARSYNLWQRSQRRLRKNKWAILTAFIGIVLFVCIWAFEKAQIYMHVSKVEKLEEENKQDSIDGQMLRLIKVKTYLEKALEIRPSDGKKKTF